MIYPRVVTEPTLEDCVVKMKLSNPRDLTPKAYPFDPIERAKQVENFVMRGDERLYYKFRYQDYYEGIATADTVGCNIMCAYCWNYSKNLNPVNVKGQYCSPSTVAKKLDDICERKKISQVRISGAEPFLGEASTKHLANTLELMGDKSFIIETNGIMLGYQPALINLIEPYKPYVRLTIKADSPSQFEAITGGISSAYKHQINAFHGLKKAHVDVGVAIMSQFVDTMRLLHLKTPIEKEDLINYSGTQARLKVRGISENKPMKFKRIHTRKKVF